MPLIHVKSLVFAPPLCVSAVVEGITQNFATGTGKEIEHITATWELLPSENDDEDIVFLDQPGSPFRLIKHDVRRSEKVISVRK